MNAAFQSGFASALLDVLFNKVTDFVIVELRKVKECDAALEKLETTIMLAQRLLNQVDAFELQGRLKSLMQKKVDILTDLCYTTEDLMDELSLMIADHQNSLKPVRTAILKSPQSWFKPHKINKLQYKFDAILKQLEALVEITIPSETIMTGQSNGHHKPNMEMALPLRETDVKEIVQELISRNCNNHGVSILGIDGLGKTTLAIQVEARVVTHFAFTLWVDVLGCFDSKQIIQQLDQLHSNLSPRNNKDQLQSILIIFDDLLEVTLVEWNAFWSHVITKGINGTRYKIIKFLITTFNPTVAKNTGTCSRHLKPLSDEDCEKVILATSRSYNQHLSDDVHFQPAAASLAKKCRGLPSVSSILGVALAQYDAEEVRNILNGDLWDSDLFRDEIFPALKPCYSKAQSHLKRCLAYFSLFPPNHSFTIDDLVQLWVGEGFIQGPQGATVANNHFTDLLGMSILRLSDQKAPNGMQKYELNPLGHKFAQLAASRTCFRFVQGMPNFHVHTRHLSSSNAFYDYETPLWDKLKKLEGLRTFLSLCESNISRIPPKAFKGLTRLRVLSLSQSDVTELPDSINCLENLHYLDISHTLIKTLPETLSNVHTLQFLKLVKKIGNLTRLPTNFHKLTNMIGLDWDVSDINHMGLPSNIGKLTSLQTLPLFPVRDTDGHRITQLRNMDGVHKKLRIIHLENIREWATAKFARLCEKSFLEGVKLEWMSSKNHTIAKHVLTCLKPHQNLKKLKITNYYGDEFPEWMTNAQELPVLKKMHLCKCQSIKVLPELGRLPSLKVLHLQKIRNVVNEDHNLFQQGQFPNLEKLVFEELIQVQGSVVVLESKAMPSLRDLTFINCSELRNMSSLSHLTSLANLKIEGCGTLRSLPNLPISLESLTIAECVILSYSCNIGGCDWPKVDCIQSVEIEGEKIPTSGSNSLQTTIDISPSPGQQLESSLWGVSFNIQTLFLNLWLIFLAAILARYMQMAEGQYR